MMQARVVIRCIASLGIGLGVSTGYPIGIAAAFVMPPLAMFQPTRGATYGSAFCYYAGALWPLIPAARNFFGPKASFLEGIAAWLAGAILLATPWPLAWTTCRVQLLWRVPLALIATVLPPLGLIGWASPLTATGFVFPGTAWFGLLALFFICAGLCMKSTAFYTVLSLVTLGILTQLSYRGDPQPPREWETFDTHFGAVAHGAEDPIREYMNAEWIQTRVQSSHAHVVIFPEMVVPRWSAATDLFWQRTLAKLSANGKTILVGAGLSESASQGQNRTAALVSYDFAAAAAALRGGDLLVPRHAVQLRGIVGSDVYRNAIVIRGGQSGTFLQRIPVPVGMWHPFSEDGVPLNLSGPGVIRIGNQRAAILICYEQLLTWPFLVSAVAHPTVIIATANEYWVEQTPIPRYQATAVRAWARLFRISSVSAANW